MQHDIDDLFEIDRKGLAFRDASGEKVVMGALVHYNNDLKKAEIDPLHMNNNSLRIRLGLLGFVPDEDDPKIFWRAPGSHIDPATTFEGDNNG